MAHVRYTLAQHDGLPNAVLVAPVAHDAVADAVARHGGVLFDSFVDADDAALDANYGPDNHGLNPSVHSGRFVGYRVAGYRLYVPAA